MIVLQTEPALAETFIARMDAEAHCAVKAARDGASLTPGTVHIAADPDQHVVVEAGQPPKLRLVARDPVDGARPSATLLYASVARAEIPAVGVVLTGSGIDGAKGLKLMRDAGCDTLAQDPASATVSEAPKAAIAAEAVQREVGLHDLCAEVLKLCNVG